MEQMDKGIRPDARKVFQGIIFSVWQWKQKLYDGSAATFEGLSRRDSVNIIGLLPDKQVLLVWDEQPDRPGVLTPAGGAVEIGESLQEAARREFLEETGYRIKELIPWYTYCPFNKITWAVHTFIGRNCERVQDQWLERGERIEPRYFSFDDFLLLGKNPDLRDLFMRTILLEALLEPKKQEKIYNLFYG